MPRATRSDAERPTAVVSAAPAHFELFDGLRAIAALFVLVSHASMITGATKNTWFGPMTSRLTLGVVVFFVISGFLLYRPFFRARYEGSAGPRLGEYARRRVLRIVPAYWVALTILSLWLSLPGAFGHQWYVYYGFGQVYSEHTRPLGLGVAWTLCVEVTFYLVLPLYALGVGRLQRGLSGRALVRVELAALLALALAANVFRWAVQLGHLTLVFTLPATFDWFALGMGLAVASVVVGDLHREAPRIVRLVVQRPWLCWAAAVVLFLVMVYTLQYTPHWHPPAWWLNLRYAYEHLLQGVIAVLIVAPAVFGGATKIGFPRRLLSWRFVAWLGLVSYGIYLWHASLMWWLIKEGVFKISPTNPLPVLVVTTFGLAVVAAALSWYVIERPLMRFRSVGRRRRS